MDPVTAILAFSLAAALLTVTPGLDTALVLRTATVEGAKHAAAAGIGIVAGVLAWGLLAALGLGAVLAMSEIGYRILQYAGAAYLFWLGSRMLAGALRPRPAAPDVERAADAGITAPAMASGSASGWFWRGLMTNLLNPKVGVFYVSFLPQFLPAGVPVVGFSIFLAVIHAVMSVVWFGAVIAATQSVSRVLRRPAFARAVDGLTGSVLIAFGVRLALERRA